MLCAEPRSNFSSTPNVMAICNSPVTTMVPHRTPILLLAALLIPTTVFAADFSGRVVGVLDGDTIEVLHHGQTERIRLNGIDCPEKSQAYSTQAKQAAQNWSTGRNSRLSPSARTSTGVPLLK